MHSKIGLLLIFSSALMGCTVQGDKEDRKHLVNDSPLISSKLSSKCYNELKLRLKEEDIILFDSSTLEWSNAFYFEEIEDVMGINFRKGLQKAFYLKVKSEVIADSNFCYLFIHQYVNGSLPKQYESTIDSIYKLPYNKINDFLFDEIHKDENHFFSLGQYLIYYPLSDDGILGLLNERMTKSELVIKNCEFN